MTRYIVERNFLHLEISLKPSKNLIRKKFIFIGNLSNFGAKFEMEAFVAELRLNGPLARLICFFEYFVI